MSKKFNNLNRTRFYLNESSTALRLVQILTHSHLVLQDGLDSLTYRSLPNTFARSIATLLLNYLSTHSNIPQDRLAHQYREIYQCILSSTSPSAKKGLTKGNEKEEIHLPTESVETTSTPQTPVTAPLLPESQPQTQEESDDEKELRQQEQQQEQQQKHTKGVAAVAAAKFSCQTCIINFPTIALYRAHLRSPEHQQKLRSKPTAGPAVKEVKESNPESKSLQAHQPSSISFGPQHDDDTADHDGEQKGLKSHSKGLKAERAGHGEEEIEIEYHQVAHPSGVLDFKYSIVDDDDETEIGPSSATSRKAQNHQRRMSTESNASENGNRKGGKDKKGSKKGSKHSASLNSTSETDHTTDYSDSGYSDASEYEDDVLGGSNDNNNAKNDAISNKAGTQIAFVSYPIAPASPDPRSTTPNPHQSYYFTTSRHHHPQNIVLTSPQLGLLLVPARAAQMSSLSLSVVDDDDDGTVSSNKTKLAIQRASYNPIIQASFMHFFRLISQAMPYKASSVLPPVTAMIMDSGGKFALTIFLGNVILYHTSFANYTTRKKQGKSQSSHDRAGGNASSAGATIRRQQIDRHRERIREVLYHLRGELSCCQQILLYIPSHLMREQLFLSKEQQASWVQSGGVWIGQSSNGIEGPSKIQLSLEGEENNINNYQFSSELIPYEFTMQPSDIVDSDEDDENRGLGGNGDGALSQPITSTQKTTSYSPNHALLTTQRDNYQGNIEQQYPVSSVPLTTAIAIPNLTYYLNSKYSSAINHLNTNHRMTIDKSTGDYQMLYFQRLDKKKNKNNKMQLLTSKSILEDDDDDNDLAHTDHSITAEWHRDTLIYHYNNSSSFETITAGSLSLSPTDNKSPKTDLSPDGDFSNSSSATQKQQQQQQQLQKRVVYVDSFLPNTPVGGVNLNPNSFQADLTAVQPPRLLGPIQLPSTSTQQIAMKKSLLHETDQQQYPTSSYRLSSFLDPTVIANVKPSLYTIQPYHPHSARANYTPQHEHLYLLHPNDPRITNLGLTVRDAKHAEIVRIYQQLMLCKIKSLESMEE